MLLRLTCALALLTLGACATAETHEVARSFWQDDPDSLRVIDNELSIAAGNACHGGYELLSREKGFAEGRHVMRWRISCAR